MPLPSGTSGEWDTPSLSVTAVSVSALWGPRFTHRMWLWTEAVYLNDVIKKMV